MNELDKILKKAEKEHDLLKHPYVGTEHLLLAILSYDNELTDELKKEKLTYNKFKRKIKEIIGEGSNKSPYILYTPMLRKVIDIAKKDNYENINEYSLYNAIIEANEGIALKIIESMNIKIDKINNYENNQDIIITNRDDEINQILQILMRKNKCNPILIGDAGVGKTAIVEEIQRRLRKNEVPTSLKGYNIKPVDMASMVAGTKYRGDFEERINNLLKSVENKKTIIFIDEIHTLVNAGGAEGAISAGNIIKPYLARGKVKCIGATTKKEYHEYFEKDEALNRRFEKVIIEEPNYTQMKSILISIKEPYEKYHNIKIEDNIFDEILYISNKYITNKKNPDKSIELLDSCCSNARFKEQQIVSVENLYDVLKTKYKIDISNNYIREIIDNKEILIADKQLINTIKQSNNITLIDGNNYKCEDDLYKIYGNIRSNNNYILKKIYENPVGILILTNINYNNILKEFISKIINNRFLIDNYGNNINLNNYIIILDNIDKESSLGFKTNKNKSNIIFKELTQKTLLTCL